MTPEQKRQRESEFAVYLLAIIGFLSCGFVVAYGIAWLARSLGG